MPQTSITIRHNGITYNLTADFNGESILDAALMEGINLPYSCKNGICGILIHQLTEQQAERAAGRINRGDIGAGPLQHARHIDAAAAGIAPALRHGVTRSAETDRSIAGFMVSVTTSAMVASCLVSVVARRAAPQSAIALCRANPSIVRRPGFCARWHDRPS